MRTTFKNVELNTKLILSVIKTCFKVILNMTNLRKSDFDKRKCDFDHLKFTPKHTL